jgi:hypothetical protein
MIGAANGARRPAPGPPIPTGRMPTPTCPRGAPRSLDRMQGAAWTIWAPTCAPSGAGRRSAPPGPGRIPAAPISALTDPDPARRMGCGAALAALTPPWIAPPGPGRRCAATW